MADTPAFREMLEREFSPRAAELFQGSRRRFLKLMGASLGLAGLAGCIRRDEEKLAPYAHRPVSRMPGVPVSYATAMEIGGIAQGLLVTSVDGRPIKIEGNPSHPLNRGAADAIAQASILQLYDPDRSRGVIRRDKNGRRSEVGWDEFARWAKEHFTGDGSDLYVVSEASNSPSLAAMRERLMKAMPKAAWFEREPLSYDGDCVPPNSGFGCLLWGVLELSRAKVIVALDADLFGGGNPMAIKHARDFAAGRRLDHESGAQMNRLYVVEPSYTITGACADHRRPLRRSLIPALVNELGQALGAEPGSNGAVPGEGPGSGLDPAFTRQLAADLRANAGQCVLAVGPGQSLLTRRAVAEINAGLGNHGKTITYLPLPEFPPEPDPDTSNSVGTVLVLGGNPVYGAPGQQGEFERFLKGTQHTIHLGLHDDETSQLCEWHLSQAHFLEAWGDVRTYDGTVSIVQPLIEPLFDGRSAIEVLATILGDKAETDGGGYEIVRRTFRSLVGDSNWEWKWKKALADGVVEGTAWKPEPFDGFSGQRAAGAQLKDLPPPPMNDYEVVFMPDSKVYDGRFANNGWLQELPDPMTRLTWGNAACMNPKTAEAIGVKPDELVALQAEDTPEILIPAFILPGVADGVIALSLGYGRTAAGNIGNGVGTSAYVLQDDLGHLRFRTGVKARATGKTLPLATVQDHHIIDSLGRRAVQARIPELIREGTLAQWRQDPSLGHKEEPAESLFNEHPFDGRSEDHQDPAYVPDHDLHRWGMAIDLNACTGCGACVVACQAENNIPIVGREQVLHGREMHWIRVDRYFRGGEGEEKGTGTSLRSEPVPFSSPVAVHQPVPCMQCENAPCEEVCPVAATTHSREGLNMMTYNRCVGTRYCSNNCPYKVRRFNFFDYSRGTLADLYTPNLVREPISELLRMQKNPEVTVRVRGVMEKCTYCIQRIEAVRIAAKREGDRPIRDGEIRTACQQTCPTGAIVFGDLNDPDSRVSKLQKLARAYAMLDPELHTKPRTQYLAKVRNPAPGLDEKV